MNNSKAAIEKILVHEGGYVNDPRDPGGATNKGITIATFRRYIKPKGTIADLKALTTAQAVVVYKRQYWDKVMGDDLPTGVAYATADFAVNSGPSRAAKMLQKVVGVAQDGRIGPATLKAVMAVPARVVVNRLCDERLAYMKRIRHRKTGALLWNTYKNGWSKRVSRVRETSLGWASTTPPKAKAPAYPAAKPKQQSGGILAALFSLFGGRK